jgi:hypothetical protein
VHVPWRKTQRENFRLLGAAFLQRRSLPLRRLARTLAGPTPQVKAADKRLRRFLGNDRLALDAALGAYLRFLLPRFGAVPFIPVMLDWTYVKERVSQARTNIPSGSLFREQTKRSRARPSAPCEM